MVARDPDEAQADPGLVADAIVNVVATTFGERPSGSISIRPKTAPMSASTVLDRMRAEMLHRVGLSDLLKPNGEAAMPLAASISSVSLVSLPN